MRRAFVKHAAPLDTASLAFYAHARVDLVGRVRAFVALSAEFQADGPGGVFVGFWHSGRASCVHARARRASPTSVGFDGAFDAGRYVAHCGSDASVGERGVEVWI